MDSKVEYLGHFFARFLCGLRQSGIRSPTKAFLRIFGLVFLILRYQDMVYIRVCSQSSRFLEFWILGIFIFGMEFFFIYAISKKYFRSQIFDS